MTGMRRAIKLFLLIVVLELMLFSHTESWRRRRRRRRRYVPPCDSSLPPAAFKWANKWHQSFTAQCPKRYSMTQWISIYRKCQQDRVHHFRCRYGPAPYYRDCSWTPHFLHDATQPLHYRCPHDGFITGVYSYFVKASKDRRVYIKCCKAPRYKHHRCKSTRWTKLGESFNYKTSRKYWMTGVTSVYSSSSGDRQWKFEHCKIIKKRYYRSGKK
ncbi:unnamed protein product [Porites lobata]|uniref:Uncharacterized protein n=1 Tax=Porites lobata TaxID=104759 RepID=A0ABN8PUX4_9CNID|nr:unnamed protein product [Porites lobata]